MTPRINGKLHSYASLTLKAGTFKATAIKSLTYGDSRTPVEGYGASPSFGALARTVGKYETEVGTMEIEKGILADFRKSIADQTGSKDFGSTEFEIVVSYETPGRQLITDTLSRCVFTKNAAKVDDGGDPLYDTVEFKPLFIKWNGLTLYQEG